MGGGLFILLPLVSIYKKIHVRNTHFVHFRYFSREFFYIYSEHAGLLTFAARQLLFEDLRRYISQLRARTLLIVAFRPLLRHRIRIIVNTSKKLSANNTSILFLKFIGQLLDQRIMLRLLFLRLRLGMTGREGDLMPKNLSTAPVDN